MNIRYSTLVLFAVLALSSMAYAATGSNLSFEAATDLSWNDRKVMHAMRSIHSAEMTYAATIGHGNFAIMQVLQQEQLIDDLLASGQKYGYTFQLTTRAATVMFPARFDLTATPTVRRARFLSFYMNESCEIRGAERFGREATVADPIIEPCGTSPRTERERLGMQALRTLHGVQLTYASTAGFGNYGTPQQLYDAGFMVNFLLSYLWNGYSAQFTATAATATMPARFTISIVPTEYGRSGVRSFFIDETGVLRGADKNGLPANENDPPV